MKHLLIGLVCVAAIAHARNSYTGSYSGAPGRQICASSCHGGTSGTIVVTGFPSSYQPGQVYRVVVKRNGGSLIVNYNATTRIGTTSNIGGTFATVTNSTLYTGADGGVYTATHSIDSSVFNWTAPARGTGTVNFYCAGYQGTTSSANGQSTRITLTSSEITTGAETIPSLPNEISLGQNFPNPFNPSTTIRYDLAERTYVTLQIFDNAGRLIETLQNGYQTAGGHEKTFEGKNLSSGIYVYKLIGGNKTETRKMVLLK